MLGEHHGQAQDSPQDDCNEDAVGVVLVQLEHSVEVECLDESSAQSH